MNRFCKFKCGSKRKRPLLRIDSQATIKLPVICSGDGNCWFLKGLICCPKIKRVFKLYVQQVTLCRLQFSDFPMARGNFLCFVIRYFCHFGLECISEEFLSKKSILANIGFFYACPNYRVSQLCLEIILWIFLCTIRDNIRDIAVYCRKV